MIITLSEEQNEKIVCEWSGEISDKTAQDFCDVCNSVFTAHFDLDYMRRKYDRNIYGKSLISVMYKDGNPVAAEGAWRNDIDGHPSFQICDTATLQPMRKRGYNAQLIRTIFDEVKNFYPCAIFYRFSMPISYHIAKLLGFARTLQYLRFYMGMTKDFQKSVPVIEDLYVEKFFLNKKNVYVWENTHRGGGA